MITKKQCDRLLFDKVRDAYNEDVVRGLLLPDPEPSIEWKEIYTEEEINLVKDNLRAIRDSPDFEIEGDNIYLKGVKLPLVPVVLASFIQALERLHYSNDEGLEAEYQSLKMFWLKLATSPRQESREQVLNFCKNNDIRLSKTGNLS